MQQNNRVHRPCPSHRNSWSEPTPTHAECPLSMMYQPWNYRWMTTQLVQRKYNDQTWYCRWTSQNREYRWVRVIIGHWIDWAESRQVVFVGCVVPMPCHHIERWKALWCTKHFAPKFAHKIPRLLHIFKSGHWCQEISRVCQPVCPYKYSTLSARVARAQDLCSSFLRVSKQHEE